MYWAVAALGVAALSQSLQAQNNLAQMARVNELYGYQIVSSDNQKIGKLNNMMIDLETGRILYCVIGTSKGRVGVAPEIFDVTPASKELHISVPKAKIDSAPQFSAEADTPTEWGKAGFVDQVYQYFGQRAWWQGNGPANVGIFHNVHKSSDLLGMKVEDVSNQSLGKVQNVIVNLRGGRVLYVLLAPDSRLKLASALYPLPPQALTPSADGKNLVSGIDQQKLASAPHFDSKSPPNFSDRTYASQVYQYYGKQPWF